MQRSVPPIADVIMRRLDHDIDDDDKSEGEDDNDDDAIPLLANKEDIGVIIEGWGIGGRREEDATRPCGTQHMHTVHTMRIPAQTKWG